jgi:hypothetical protein
LLLLQQKEVQAKKLWFYLSEFVFVLLLWWLWVGDVFGDPFFFPLQSVGILSK